MNFGFCLADETKTDCPGITIEVKLSITYAWMEFSHQHVRKKVFLRHDYKVSVCCLEKQREGSEKGLEGPIYPILHEERMSMAFWEETM